MATGGQVHHRGGRGGGRRTCFCRSSMYSRFTSSPLSGLAPRGGLSGLMAVSFAKVASALTWQLNIGGSARNYSRIVISEHRFSSTRVLQRTGLPSHLKRVVCSSKSDSAPLISEPLGAPGSNHLAVILAIACHNGAAGQPEFMVQGLCYVLLLFLKSQRRGTRVR